MTTNICVESTARDAAQRDYRTYVVGDAVAEIDPDKHKHALSTLAYAFCRVVGRDEIVAPRVETPGCSGRMLDWWFTFFHSSEHFRLWNPIDHREFGWWDEHWGQGESYVGATTSSTQSLMRVNPAPVVIKFHDPSELFTPGRLKEAFAKGDVSAAMCAYIGNGNDPRATHTATRSAGV